MFDILLSGSSHEAIWRQIHVPTDASIDDNPDGRVEEKRMEGLGTRVVKTPFNAVLIRLVCQIRITLLLKIQWKQITFYTQRLFTYII